MTIVRRLRQTSVTTWIFVALVVGVLLGVFLPDFARTLSPISNIFLRLIKSIVAPLLFGTLVYGIAASGELKSMGRIALKTFIYFEIATTLALVIGLTFGNVFQPGNGIKLDPASAAELTINQKQLTVTQILEHTAPENIFESLGRNDVLQLVVFFFLFAAACASVGAKARPVVEFAGSVAEVMFRYTKFVMYLAPFGVGAAIAVTVATKGVAVLTSLGKLVGTLYLAQITFVVLVIGIALTIARIPIRKFWRATREPFLLAFSTASSESALPIALENMESFGVPKHIVGFVLPTGYSFNLDGSTLYLAVASLFVAQAAGIDMPITTQITMMLTLMLTSKGVAAVPRASLVILAGTLATFHLPLEGIAVILGVDALMDMCRTSVNLLGNCAASAVVASWEGHKFDSTDSRVRPTPNSVT